MFVSGITPINAKDRLDEAQNKLNEAVRSGVSDEELKILAKSIVDIKNTITAMETREQNAYTKLSAKDKLIVDAQKKNAEEIYNKEKQDREEAERKIKQEEEARREKELKAAEQRQKEQEERLQKRWDSIHDSVVNVGTTISKSVNTIADTAFHALLGPLNLLVNPLEKALNFNLFDLGKKTAVDILTLPIKPLRYDIEKKGGLIGATGIFIADTITKALGKTSLSINGEDIESGADGFSQSLGSTIGGGIGSIAVSAAKGLFTPGGLFIAGVAALVTAAIVNHWDEKGPEIADEAIAVFNDPNSEWYLKLWTTGKSLVMGFFGGIVNAIEEFSNNKTLMEQLLYGEEGAQKWYEKMYASILALGKGQVDVWAQYNTEVRKWTTAIDNPNSEYYWKTEALKLLDPSSPFFDGVTNAGDLAYLWGIENYVDMDRLEELAEELKKSSQGGKQYKALTFTPTEEQVQQFIDSQQLDEEMASEVERIKKEVRAKKAAGVRLPGFVSLMVDEEGNLYNPNTPGFQQLPATTSDAFELLNKQTSSTEEQEEALKNWEEFEHSQKWYVKFWNRLIDTMTYANDRGQTVNDAIISKDNNLYIPSDDDNILVTKSEIASQPAVTTAEFQTELFNLLKTIANNLKQPTVVNNVRNATNAIDFGGMRL